MNKIPAYKPSLFTSRDKIIAEILKRAEPGARTVFGRTIVIRGERGSGKSWLALHLHREILPRHSIKSFLIRLSPPAENEIYVPGKDEWLIGEGEQERNQVILEILKQVAVWSGVLPEDTNGASAGQLSTWLGNKISANVATTYAILVDSAFEAPWPLLDLLERYLLATLASLPNILLIITGRGEPYPWQSAYLRTEKLDYRLSRFTEEETVTALSRFEKEKDIPVVSAQNALRIHNETKGHPLMTVLRAMNVGWDEVVANLLMVIPGQEKRKEYRTYLEALAVLEGFRDGEIAPMMFSYTGDLKYHHYPDSKSRDDIREPLVMTKLVSWGSGFFEIDKDLRLALCQFLIHEKPEYWVKQNQAAEQLYRKWMDQYPRARNFYQGQIERYQKQEENRTLVFSEP